LIQNVNFDPPIMFKNILGYLGYSKKPKLNEIIITGIISKTDTFTQFDEVKYHFSFLNLVRYKNCLNFFFQITVKLYLVPATNLIK
jgi:hypothetical protein